MYLHVRDVSLLLFLSFLLISSFSDFPFNIAIQSLMFTKCLSPSTLQKPTARPQNERLGLDPDSETLFRWEGVGWGGKELDEDVYVHLAASL